MPRVVLDDLAVTDLDGIFDHIGRTLKSPQAAAQTVLRIRESCETHASQPGIGQARPDLGHDVRTFPVGSYVVVYRPLVDGIHVFRIFLGRRNYPALFRDGPV
jgi:toxin ParE1/3/4